MPLTRNLPTPEGREEGRKIAEFVDAEDSRLRAEHPNLRQRCASCALRKGTMANGCAATLSDAMKCVIERRGFDCHETHEQCAGYQLAITAFAPAIIAMEGKAPWEFSTSENDDAEIKERTPKGPWWKEKIS